MCFEVKQGVCFALRTQCNTCGLQVLYCQLLLPSWPILPKFTIPNTCSCLFIDPVCINCTPLCNSSYQTSTFWDSCHSNTAAAADIRAKDIFWMEIWPGESTWTVMSFCCQQTIDDRTAACLSWAGLPLSSTLHGWAQNGILRFGPTTLITQWA